MILTLDVGNTQISGGLFSGDKLALQFRKTAQANSSSDEIGIFLRSVLRENGFDWQQVQKIGICSVVPAINYSLSSAITKYLKKDSIFIQAGIKTGLKLKYSNPKEIGADRIAGAIGATSLFPEKNLIVIDMGTATTVDCITKNKEYLGGAILPGIKMSANALASGTAKLPSVEIAKPEHICGTTTTEAIQNGLYFGTAGAIKEILYLFKKNVFKGEETFVIGTGGFSRIFEEYSLFDTFCPELVLLGVKKSVEMNS